MCGRLSSKFVHMDKKKTIVSIHISFWLHRTKFLQTLSIAPVFR
jgi:hypothetical protein